jgi:multicomponent Na+:H+ antiporter subunit B
VNVSVRTWLFVIAACAVGALLLYGVAGLQPFGFYPGPYGDVLNRLATAQRHVLNVATAVNFDYRGFDTLIEEFILFTAVGGVALLFRDQVGPDAEISDEAELDREIPPESDGIGWLCYGMLPVIFGFACYMAIHSQLTPGGGFQGGAIGGSGFALIYMGLGYATYRKFAKQEIADAVEAAGAGAYVVIGIAMLVIGGAFLRNALPLGTTGSIASAGTIALINCCVFVEIGAGFIVCLELFFAQTRRVKEQK